VDLVWTCPCCGKQYDTLPFAYVVMEPDAWRAVPVDERSERGTLWTDTCIIDQQQFYVRGRILVPVAGHTEPFIFNLWAAVSQQDFVRYGQLWDVERRAQEAPLAGRLANTIAGYPPALGLECKVVLQDARVRPSFELPSPDHPLALEQRRGITLDRVKEIAAVMQQHRK
jgi:hypothetical protein